MKFNSAILALGALVTWVNLSGVTCRSLGGGNLVTTGAHHGLNRVDTRGLTGPKRPKGDKGGSDGPDGASGGSSGGIGGLGGGNGGRGSGRGGSVIGGLGSPGSQSGMTKGDRELDNFGLKRVEKGQASSEGPFVGFIAPAGTPWKQFSISPKDDKVETYGNKAIYEYQTLVFPLGSGAINTKFVETKDRNLPEGLNRRTLLKNGWTDAGGDPGKLIVLGDTDIINAEVRRSIDDALAQKQKDGGNFPQEVEFKPNEKGWDEINNNAFIGGYNKMLDEDKGAFKDAYISKIWVIIDKAGRCHLRTHLGRSKRPASESPGESSLSESD